MTHKEIFTKFMIEYDKANVTSSYPSLTEYEVATFLDKAYMALIALKVTGNNIRRSSFEQDTKNIADLQPLVITETLMLLGKTYNPFEKLDDDDVAGKLRYGYEPNTKYMYGSTSEVNSAFLGDVRSMPDNVRSTTIPNDMLYFVSAYVPVDMHMFAGWMNDEKYVTGKKIPTSDMPVKDNTIHPMDNKDEDYAEGKLKRFRLAQVVLTNHQTAEKFFASAYSIPWVKRPVAYIENNRLFVVADPIVGIPELPYTATIDVNGNHISGNREQGEYVSLTYIKKPHTFVKDLSDSHFNNRSDEYDYFNPGTNYENDVWYQFELNDVVAEELISTAITYALENVESQRLTPHVNLRGLES